MTYHQATYADGRSELVPATDSVQLEFLGRRTAEECLVLGDEVLIGQTVLQEMDLQVDSPARKVVPNPEHPDFPSFKIRRASADYFLVQVYRVSKTVRSARRRTTRPDRLCSVVSM